MELIRTPVIPMLTPTTENLVEGEIVNINKGKSIGIVKTGRVVDILQKSAHRMLEDESIAISSDIDYSNSIGYLDKDDKVLMYKVYGVVVDMNNSDYDGCVSPYTEFTSDMDVEKFIKEFLGFKKEIEGYTGREYYIMNNFYYSYTIADNKILFLVSRGEMDDSYRAFAGGDTITFKFGTNIYDEDLDNKFTFKHFTLFNSILWLLLRSTNIARNNLEGLKEYSEEMYDFFYGINNVWIYNTYDIERVPVDSYISKYKINHDIIIPSEYEGSSNTYFCTRFLCDNYSETRMYFLDNQLITTSNYAQVKTIIEVM